MTSLALFNASKIFTLRDEKGLIGCGTSARVRFCKSDKLGEFAVKCFPISGNRSKVDERKKKLLTEAEVLQNLTHQNIIQVHGITLWSNSLGILTDYLPCGNLEDLLMSSTVKEIPWPLRIRIAFEISDALCFLHNYKAHRSLVHGDLKPQNILMTDELKVKLADFGSVSLVAHTGASSMSLATPKNVQHTALYTAPEFLKNVNIDRTAAMDIYSYGMVLYEITTRTEVFGGVPCNQNTLITLIIDRDQKPNPVPLERIKNSITGGDLERFNLLVTTMQQCWKYAPEERPTVNEVRTTLSNCHKKTKGPELLPLIAQVLREMTPSSINIQNESSLVSLECFTFPFERANFEVTAPIPSTSRAPPLFQVDSFIPMDTDPKTPVDFRPGSASDLNASIDLRPESSGFTTPFAAVGVWPESTSDPYNAPPASVDLRPASQNVVIPDTDKDFIYILTKQSGERIFKLQRFDLKSKEFRVISHFRMDSGLTTMICMNSKVYLLGPRVYSFDTRVVDAKWEELAPMNKPRTDCCVAIYHGKIYVSGGHLCETEARKPAPRPREEEEEETPMYRHPSEFDAFRESRQFYRMPKKKKKKKPEEEKSDKQHLQSSYRATGAYATVMESYDPAIDKWQIEFNMKGSFELLFPRMDITDEHLVCYGWREVSVPEGTTMSRQRQFQCYFNNKTHHLHDLTLEHKMFANNGPLAYVNFFRDIVYFAVFATGNYNYSYNMKHKFWNPFDLSPHMVRGYNIEKTNCCRHKNKFYFFGKEKDGRDRPFSVIVYDPECAQWNTFPTTELEDVVTLTSGAS